MPHLTEAQWIAIAAHRLQRRGCSINPGQLDDVAAELGRIKTFVHSSLPKLLTNG